MIKPGLNVTPAIVLAAGASSRIGRPKANLALEDGDTFLSRIVKTFRSAGIEDVVVVVGFEADSIVETFARTGEASAPKDFDATATKYRARHILDELAAQAASAPAMANPWKDWDNAAV